MRTREHRLIRYGVAGASTDLCSVARFDAELRGEHSTLNSAYAKRASSHRAEVAQLPSSGVVP